MDSTLIFGDGKGKTTYLHSQLFRHILEGGAVVYFGENARDILETIPKRHERRTIYIDPKLYPYQTNYLIGAGDHIHFAKAFTEALLPTDITPYRAYTFRRYFTYGLLTLLKAPNPSLLHLNKFLTDSSYRFNTLKNVRDRVIKRHWRLFEELPEKERRLDIESTLSVLSDIELVPEVRDCLFDPENKLVFDGKIVLFQLESGNILGTLGQAYLTAVPFNTTVFIDGDYGNPVPLMQKYQSYVVRRGTELVNHAKHLVAFRIPFEESERLASLFDLHQDNTAPQLWELPDYHFYSGKERGYVADLTLQSTGMADLIKKRCMNQCPPRKSIEKRIQKFYGA